VRTAIVSTVCVESPGHGVSSIIRSLEWHKGFFKQWEVDAIMLFNNGDQNPPPEKIFSVHPMAGAFPELDRNKVHLFTHTPRIHRKSVLCYPGIWRSLQSMIRAVMHYGFERFIYLEWDFRILSPDMADEIANTRKGVVSYWNECHEQPETACHICCAENFNDYKLGISGTHDHEPSSKVDRMEFAIPWTEVRKHRKGDRYGEWTIPVSIPDNTDFIAQMFMDQQLVKNKEGGLILEYWLPLGKT
jgi:hypothetical protein